MCAVVLLDVLFALLYRNVIISWLQPLWQGLDGLADVGVQNCNVCDNYEENEAFAKLNHSEKIYSLRAKSGGFQRGMGGGDGSWVSASDDADDKDRRKSESRFKIGVGKLSPSPGAGDFICLRCSSTEKHVVCAPVNLINASVPDSSGRGPMKGEFLGLKAQVFPLKAELS